MCVQLANVFTRNLFLSLFLSRTTTNDDHREEKRKGEREKKRRGYTFCVILIENRKKKRLYIDSTESKKKTRLKFIESHVLYVTKLTIFISFRLLFQQMIYVL